MMIYVLAGGASAERDISLKSGRAVQKAFETLGFRTCLWDGALQEIYEIDSEECELAFIALHGGFGENGQIQAILEEKGIPFTSSDSETCRWSFDKRLSKAFFLEASVAVAPYICCRPHNTYPLYPPFALPWIVKPSAEGSSFGVSLVESVDDYEDALDEAFRYDHIALVEPKIDGREMTVGVVAGQVLDPIEIIPRSSFFDYYAKYNKGATRYVCDPQLTFLERTNINAMVQRLLRESRLTGVFRIDFILSKAVPVVLEVNTVPGFTETSLVPMAASRRGIGFEELCATIVDDTIKRHNQEEKKWESANRLEKMSM